MKVKLLVTLGLLAALVVIATACGSPAQPTAAPPTAAAANPTAAPAQPTSAPPTEAAANPTSAPAGQKQQISIMVGGLNKIIYLAAMLTKQLGYFDAEGLDVQLLDEPAGVNAEDAMLSGQVNAVVGFYDHNIDLQGKGKKTESVVQLDWVPGEVELISSKLADQIKSPADFKGRNLGVTGIGSSTYFLTLYMSVKNGLTVDQVHPIAVGAGDTFIAAMTKGQIDAGMTTEPTVSRMLKSGDAKILIDMRTADGTKAALGGTYPAACVYMQTDWANSHKDAVQKMVNAFVKTLKWIHSHSAEEIAAKMPQDYYAGDKDLYIAALKGSLDMFTPDGRMPADGPPTVLNVLSAFDKNIQGKQIDLSATYTNEFVDNAQSAQ
jgi:NitT/TauT family transport system substrate-binding protein